MRIGRRCLEIHTETALPQVCADHLDSVLVVEGLLCTAVGRRRGRIVAFAVGGRAAEALRRLGTKVGARVAGGKGRLA